jgi:Vacuolar protein 14 C-terminal Fig4p binding
MDFTTESKKHNIATFSQDLRILFMKKAASRDRNYCMKLLIELADQTADNQPPNKVCMVLSWVRDILSIQLDVNHNTYKVLDKRGLSFIEKGSSVVGRSSCSPVIVSPTSASPVWSNSEEYNHSISFESLVSQNLQLALTNQNSEDQELNNIATQLSKLIKKRVIDIIKFEKERGTNILFFKIFEGLQSLIVSQQSGVMSYVYRWVEYLLDNFPDEVTSQSDALVKNLSDPKIDRITMSVVLIAKIAKKQGSTRLLESIMDHLQSAETQIRSAFYQEKCLSIFRTLFSNFQPEDHDKLLKFLTGYLVKSTKDNFKKVVVKDLSLIINLEENLFQVRNMLKSEQSHFFEMLFSAWCVSPAQALGLSLLSERYYRFHI